MFAAIAIIVEVKSIALREREWGDRKALPHIVEESVEITIGSGTIFREGRKK